MEDMIIMKISDPVLVTANAGDYGVVAITVPDAPSGYVLYTARCNSGNINISPIFNNYNPLATWTKSFHCRWVCYYPSANVPLSLYCYYIREDFFAIQ